MFVISGWQHGSSVNVRAYKRYIGATHDAELVGVFLADGSCILADERALRIEDERQG